LPSPNPGSPEAALAVASEVPDVAPWNGGILPAGGLRVVEVPEGQGLVDSILSTVSAQFFGF
jgi:hypothetical protein